MTGRINKVLLIFSVSIGVAFLASLADSWSQNDGRTYTKDTGISILCKRDSSSSKSINKNPPEICDEWIYYYFHPAIADRLDVLRSSVTSQKKIIGRRADYWWSWMLYHQTALIVLGISATVLSAAAAGAKQWVSAPDSRIPTALGIIAVIPPTLITAITSISQFYDPRATFVREFSIRDQLAELETEIHDSIFSIVVSKVNKEDIEPDFNHGMNKRIDDWSKKRDRLLGTASEAWKKAYER